MNDSIPLSPARRMLALCVAIASSLASPMAAQGTEPGRAVLITGCSSGIGLRMTEVLAANGFFVYAGARKAADLARLDALPNVKSVRLDVTVQREIDAAVALVRAEGRGLHGLVNNAGVAVTGPLIELSEEDLDFQLAVNLFGPCRMTKAFADLLIESKGRVMNVSSIAGILSGPFGGAYSMSKHAVEAYTDTLAAELTRFGVAVAAVEPGNYKSQILASMERRMRERGYSAENSRYGSMLDMIPRPLDRSQYREPDEVARAALDFLSSDSPKRRYLVVPDQGEAELTIRQALRELAQLNSDHPFSFDRDELVLMLDDALAEERASSLQSAQTPGGAELHRAVLLGELEVVRRYLASGADPDAREPSRASPPLITAATFGRTRVARELIEAGADLDLRNADGSTALLTAAFFGRTEIVAALLKAGADKSIRNNAGSTALDVVTVPFESIRGVYELIGPTLTPLGLELDFERIESTRPAIAAMLR